MMVNIEKLLFQTTVLFHLPLSLIWQIYLIYCLIFFPYDFVLQALGRNVIAEFLVYLL